MFLDTVNFGTYILSFGGERKRAKYKEGSTEGFVDGFTVVDSKLANASLANLFRDPIFERGRICIYIIRTSSCAVDK